VIVRVGRTRIGPRAVYVPAGASQPPANLIPPSIRRNGLVLTCDPGDWSGTPTLSFRWLVDGTAIVGATSQSWTPPASAWCSLFSCEVVGVNSAGQSLPALAPAVYIGALDVMSIPLAAAEAPFLLRGGYAGASRRYRRNDTQEERDFGFTATGNLDVAAITAWLAGATVSLLTVNRYDQTGNGRHQTQTTASLQPRAMLAGQMDVINGVPADAHYDSKWTKTADFASGTPSQFGVTVVGVNENTVPGYGIFASIKAASDGNDANNPTSARLIGMANSANEIGTYRAGGWRAKSMSAPNAPFIAHALFTNTQSVTQLNGVTNSANYAAAPLGATINLSIGSGNVYSLGESAIGKTSASFLWLTPLPDADRAILNAVLSRKYGIAMS
jgi:hypothetical protein